MGFDDTHITTPLAMTEKGIAIVQQKTIRAADEARHKSNNDWFR